MIGHQLSRDDQSQLASLDAEIRAVSEHLQRLKADREEFIKSCTSASTSAAGSSKFGDGAHLSVTDYSNHGDFVWSGELLPRATRTWPSVKSFRFDQQAICNAALDGRDTVVVMPTGGGKSLCYQLPAILDRGMTLVISPLISLSYDQCLHLREAGVSCEMMSSAVSREEASEILRRTKGAPKAGDKQEDIKVLFVTPERVAKSKTLISALQASYGANRLSRIVIDEAHCCSQMGHDFRPDYKQLSKLRKLWPTVPIMALSATLGPKVLEDVRQILGLGPMTPFKSARPGETVYFSAPLHRANLHYSVVAKDSSAPKAAQQVVDWILERHEAHSGIVYCLSRKDGETMSKTLSELSGGRIRASWYHADLDDASKMRIHERWRSGKVHVVCATIAFGMGIDLGRVRYVIHASPSKSLDGYLQESGRAGRDGKDSDCVLFYRPQDTLRIAGLVTGDRNGIEKLDSMVNYAQSYKCRKVLFGKYFRDSYGTSDLCGVCDNCIQPPEVADVTVESWQLLTALEEMYEEGGRLTLADLCNVARGLGNGQYTVVERKTASGKRKRRASQSKGRSGVFSVEDIGGKVSLSKENTERVAMHLCSNFWMAYEYNATAYSVNVYVKPGPLASRLTRLDLERIPKHESESDTFEAGDDDDWEVSRSGRTESGFSMLGMSGKASSPIELDSD
ncbi:atp-dependent dna helicase [Ceraceosorus bombacis]|uniref:ATP-dependent DNA helicase n=1 Tax=Ceraceosorus bombacis TaxID=401625 RepID=A0A0P1BU13_9BASI|nr:atp-dependent dna helicase [Ceraceosorus bombacis]